MFLPRKEARKKFWLSRVSRNRKICIPVGGIPTPLKNDGVSNSWDDYIFPIVMEK